MATFDISISCVSLVPGVPDGVRSSALTVGDVTKASDEPAPHALYVSDSTRMRTNSKALGTKGLGPWVSRLVWAIYACFFGVTSALADPTTATRTDPPRRRVAPAVPMASFRPSWDLDGTYLWIGPLAAATHVANEWDSTSERRVQCPLSTWTRIARTRSTFLRTRELQTE